MENGRPKLWNANYVKVWTIHFLIHFAFTLIVPLLPLYLSDTFGADRRTTGIVLAGYTVMALLVRPFSGYLVDSFPRKTVLFVCTFLFFSLFAGYLAAGSLVMFAVFRTLHGAPFGSATVSASTVAIDVLPSERRGEGIGYFGLSNNLATAIGPVLAVFLLHTFDNNYSLLFWISFGVSLLGVILVASLKLPPKDFVTERRVLSLDRMFLSSGWREAVSLLCVSFCHSIVMTYVAIYGREELGMTGGTGWFFTLFALGLIISRLTGAHALRNNKVSRNAAMGLLVSLAGYFIFAAVHSPWGYFSSAFIFGLGNGHMYPAFLTMFVNLAPNSLRGTANSSILTAWDAGSGLGILIGGIVAQEAGYHAAFWAAWTVFLVGVAYYFAVVRKHFETNKLR